MVFVDPGHGGEDTGAKGAKGLMEKTAVLLLAKALVDEAGGGGPRGQAHPRDDTFIPLWDRARLANEAGADLFISLHLNAARARQAKGSEVYFLTLGAGRPGRRGHRGPGERGGRRPGRREPENVVAGILDDLSQKAFLQDSERLAVAIQGQLNQLGGIKERGVKQAPFVVLRGAAMPAVLVEAAFISNPKEEAKLKDPAFRRKVAEAITQGVRRFFASGRSSPGARPSRRRISINVPGPPRPRHGPAPCSGP